MTAVRVAPDVGVLEDDGRLFVAPLPEGPILVLDGSAAHAWRAVLDGTVPADDATRAYEKAFIDAGLIVKEDV